MSLWRIAWSYLWDRVFTTLLTILSVALGVGLICAVLTLRDETRRRFEEEQRAFDMVVGGKGSRLQLVLSCVYFMDQPNPNIAYSVYEDLREWEEVKSAFPISLGDTYQGYRLVGTIPELFDYEWTSPITGEARDPYRFAKGGPFKEPMDAVIGSAVAATTDLDVGSDFIGTHGYIELPEELALDSHADSPYTVVGVLEPSGTAADRAIFVNLNSVWTLHAYDEDEVGEFDNPEDEITAILIQLESPGQRFTMADAIDREFNAMAAIPVDEIMKLYNQFLGTAKTVLLAIGYLVVVVSAITILIGLYLAILQRKRDLAVMRALGASAYEIFGAVLIEALLVTVLGVGAGAVLGKFATWVVGLYLAQTYGLGISPFTWGSEELTAYAIVSLVGLIAGILPAWQAYQTDIARDLAEL